MTEEQRKLVEDNIKLAYMVGSRYGGSEDTYQEAMVGLCKAAMTYNPELGAFSSYAVPTIEHQLQTQHRLSHTKGRWSPQRPISMDAMIFEDEYANSYNLYDFMSDRHQNTERDAINNVMASDKMISRIAPLSMLMYNTHIDQMELSKRFGCTRQYISYFLAQERRWAKYYLDHGEVPESWMNRADALRRRWAV